MGTLADSVRSSAPDARSSKDTLGRVGLVGKGALYAIVGLLALRLATGDIGADTSPVAATS